MFLPMHSRLVLGLQPESDVEEVEEQRDEDHGRELEGLGTDVVSQSHVGRCSSKHRQHMEYCPPLASLSWTSAKCYRSPRTGVY